MCNCGNKRADLSNAASSITATAPAPSTTLKVMNATFKYIGFSSLTITGSHSGQQYIFAHHGDMQMVDANDSAFMTGIAVLKRM